MGCRWQKHITLILALLFVACCPVGAQVSCISRAAVDTTGARFGRDASFHLRQTDYARYHLWSLGDSSLTNLGNHTDSLTHVVRLNDTDTIVLISLHLLDNYQSANMIENGDFEYGYTGFSVNHKFKYCPTRNPVAMLDPGTYAVDSNPSQYMLHRYLDTTYDGKMLMVYSYPGESNGYIDSLYAVTVRNLDTDAYYMVGYDVAALVTPRYTFNTELRVGDTAFEPQILDSLWEWKTASWLWHPHGADTVDISIANLNPLTDYEHQLAIDNVELRKLCMARDVVMLAARDSSYSDTLTHAACIGDSVQLGNGVIVVDTSKRQYLRTEKKDIVIVDTTPYGRLISHIFLTVDHYFIPEEIYLSSDTTITDILLRFRDLFRDTMSSECDSFLAERPWFKDYFDTSWVSDSIYFDKDITLPGVNVDGCDSIIHYHLVLPWNCSGFIQFPSAVTPNGDGINDCFGIKGLSKDRENQCLCYENNTLSIYDRWGKLVYHKKNIRFDEDFWCPSTNIASGTYFYKFAAHSFYDRRTDKYTYAVSKTGFFEIIVGEGKSGNSNP